MLWSMGLTSRFFHPLGAGRRRRHPLWYGHRSSGTGAEAVLPSSSYRLRIPSKMRKIGKIASFRRDISRLLVRTFFLIDLTGERVFAARDLRNIVGLNHAEQELVERCDRSGQSPP